MSVFKIRKYFIVDKCYAWDKSQRIRGNSKDKKKKKKEKEFKVVELPCEKSQIFESKGELRTFLSSVILKKQSEQINDGDEAKEVGLGLRGSLMPYSCFCILLLSVGDE